MYFDDSDFGRQRHNLMIREGDRQRVAANAERHERMRHQLIVKQSRRARRPRLFTLFGLLTR